MPLYFSIFIVSKRRNISVRRYFSVWRYFLPYGKSFKQLSPALIVYGKELLRHTHSQRLSKAPGAGNQSHTVPSLPPLPDKPGLVNIKILFCPYYLKILIPDPYCLCHVLFHSLLDGLPCLCHTWPCQRSIWMNVYFFYYNV